MIAFAKYMNKEYKYASAKRTLFEDALKMLLVSLKEH